MKIALLRPFLFACIGALSAGPAAADMVSKLIKADLAKGERVFKKCKSCHTTDAGRKNKSGPNLFGIVGGAVAASPNYKYSKALIEYGGNWDLDRLDAFFTKPKSEVKGTKMGFAGLKKEADRVNLIAYLNTKSDTPIKFDAPAEQASSAETAQEDYEFGVLFDAPGVEETFYACGACHSEMIVAQQGLTRNGWEEMLEWMVDEQGMSEIDEPDYSVILEYLSTHYGEDRPNFPKPNNLNQTKETE
ncbi:cytochrome c-552 [Rhodobacteraceae bacterium KLH11]|nr:cytochrome c-552 [Rhodobacteraceae bacterium KLH11]